MKPFAQFATVAALALSAAAFAGASSATVFTPLSQFKLDTFATSDFAGIETHNGAFTDVFTFTTTGLNDASAFVGQVSLNGTKDVDFTSIFLDTFAFTQTSADPTERWDLLTAVIGAGAHTITVKGNAFNTGAGPNAASYSGTLNLASIGVPEPATWGLMIVGFGGVGAVLRRRRQNVAFA